MPSHWRQRVGSAFGRLRPVRPSVIGMGPGQGLRFDPGAGDPAYATGAVELPVQEALAALLRPGDLVLDVGANVGFLSVIAARLVGPAGRVVAFEPVPANARQVRRNARLNGIKNIEVIPVAVGDHTGRARLVLARFAGGAALREAGAPPDACGEIDVAITTLDDWLAANGDRAPALVKIDVEGAEPAVLRGLAATLARAKPALLVEVDDATRAGADAKAAECTAICAMHGYTVRRLEDGYPHLAAWCVVHLVATVEATP
jgi:FkbM family methyltransferase